MYERRSGHKRAFYVRVNWKGNKVINNSRANVEDMIVLDEPFIDGLRYGKGASAVIPRRSPTTLSERHLAP
ncbi:hypothetical protein IX92_27465 (plasmid) [Vibrio coralliilyticus]|uniref:Uncharacterized protein n=1 Tax=Vibrio coralliilyticus TaxID=190893 RepID=A0AAN0W0R0_9VIBR|nr:hypothetical protein IX92_27465 [Vibrio coralliilyticus]